MRSFFWISLFIIGLAQAATVNGNTTTITLPEDSKTTNNTTTTTSTGGNSQTPNKNTPTSSTSSNSTQKADVTSSSDAQQATLNLMKWVIPTAVGGAIFLGLLIWFIVHMRRRRKEKFHGEMALPETKQSGRPPLQKAVGQRLSGAWTSLRGTQAQSTPQTHRSASPAMTRQGMRTTTGQGGYPLNVPMTPAKPTSVKVAPANSSVAPQAAPRVSTTSTIIMPSRRSPPSQNPYYTQSTTSSVNSKQRRNVESILRDFDHALENIK